MANPYLESPVNYKPKSTPDNPYQLAKAEWDRRLGGSEVRAENWRRAFFLSSAISAVAVCSCAYVAAKPRYVPLVVEVEPSSGRTEVIGKLTRASYRPDERLIRRSVEELILSLRSVSSDPVVVRRNWERVNPMLTRKASAEVASLMNQAADAPIKRFGKGTVSVETVSITKFGESSYHARWRERVFDKSGAAKESYTMAGNFSVELIDPSSSGNQIEKNPLGIMITDLEWHRELS